MALPTSPRLDVLSKSPPSSPETSRPPPPRPRIRFGAPAAPVDEARGAGACSCTPSMANVAASPTSPPPPERAPPPPPAAVVSPESTSSDATLSPRSIASPPPLQLMAASPAHPSSANGSTLHLASARSASTSTTSPPPAPSASITSLPPKESLITSQPSTSNPTSPPPAPSPYHLSPIDGATSHRLIRTVMHASFGQLQADAEAESKRLRTYLIATDLSDEAAYALDWTIGTFLRDGDTLLAIYAVDSEGDGKGGRASSKADGPASASPDARPSTAATTGSSTTGRDTPGSGTDTPPTGLPIGSGGAAMLDAQDTIRKLNSRPGVAARRAGSLSRRRARASSSPSGAGARARTPSVSRTRTPSASGAGSRPRTPSTEGLPPPTTRPARARLHAIRALTQICTRCLAKRGDVKVQIAIEVIHCKSPKHMITEAIDTLEPTLVILGSRGRSALKGVLLGSFSNYLVTKSSSPVIVARQHGKPPPKASPARPLGRAPPHAAQWDAAAGAGRPPAAAPRDAAGGAGPAPTDAPAAAHREARAALSARPANRHGRPGPGHEESPSRLARAKVD